MYMSLHIRTPKKRARVDLFKLILELKTMALEVAITIVFFVWLYRELLHQLRN